ncbi:MAG: hypothetical protein AAGA90_11390 [Actinomycetota bacterium]
MARKRKSYPLRIDPEVHAALERWAADELRSVNAQIEFLLRQAVVQAGRLRPAGEDPSGLTDAGAPDDDLG